MGDGASVSDSLDGILTTTTRRACMEMGLRRLAGPTGPVQRLGSQSGQGKGRLERTREARAGD